jgi:DNA-binding SARP family transcriptional activator
MLQIQLFGVPSFRIAGCQCRGQLGQAGQLLASFLFCFPGRVFRLDYLRDLFWGEMDESRARAAMNTALWRLRKLLAQQGKTESNHIPLVQRSEIVLNLTDELSTDARAFEQAAQGALSAAVAPMQEIFQLCSCVESYSGPLLDGETSGWAVAERERLHGLYIRILSLLANHYTRVGQFEEAIAVANKILRADPLREATHRDLIVLFALNEQRASAIRQFERLRALLREELGVAPVRETASLVDALRSDAFREHFVKLQENCFGPSTILA